MIDRLRTRLDAGRQDGFTLIELLIVIVILGILAAIVVFAVGGISDRGNKSACKADLKSVETAVEAYRAKKGTYPSAGAAGFTQLTTAPDNFLREAPTATVANNKYAITLGADGAVSATNDCNI